MSELAGLTAGNPEANTIALWHMRCAKAEAIKIRTKQRSPKDQEFFYSSNLPLNTQQRVARGGREWLK